MDAHNYGVQRSGDTPTIVEVDMSAIEERILAAPHIADGGRPFFEKYGSVSGRFRADAPNPSNEPKNTEE